MKTVNGDSEEEYEEDDDINNEKSVNFLLYNYFRRKINLKIDKLVNLN